MQIKSKKDFCAGLMFVGIGLIFAIGALNYPMGSALRMGPAYFPSILGWMLVILGAIVFFDSFFLTDPPPRETKWRGLVWILGSIMAFGAIVEPLHGGLVLACMALMMMSAYGGHEFKWKEAILNGLLMTAICVGTFYFALGLPFRLWPWS